MRFRSRRRHSGRFKRRSMHHVMRSKRRAHRARRRVRGVVSSCGGRRM